jgi:hypothetical protein
MSKGLHAGEINCLTSRLLQVNETVNWLGVFARDELPDLNLRRRPFALILNTDPRNKPGQHWLAIFAPKAGRVELFDSYGLPPNFYGLDSFDLIYNSTSFHSSSSSVCGHYCKFFLFNRTKGYLFYDIIEYLKYHCSSDFDSFVLSNINQLQSRFRTLNPCLRTGQCCKIKCQFC